MAGKGLPGGFGSPARRRALAALAALGSVLLPRLGRASGRTTPAMTEGPFYPERFSDAPAPVLLEFGVGAGQPLRLAGRVVDSAGAPVAGARVEIWQCDASGRYHHSRDRAPGVRDPGFAGFGWMTTDARGMYAFETIRPVPYPGRTPHIHIAVAAGGRPRLVSQIFVAGEPANANDMLYRWLPQPARELLTIELQPAVRGFAGRFDVVLAG